jgi:hypothetical protein
MTIGPECAVPIVCGGLWAIVAVILYGWRMR